MKWGGLGDHHISCHRGKGTLPHLQQPPSPLLLCPLGVTLFLKQQAGTGVERQKERNEGNTKKTWPHFPLPAVDRKLGGAQPVELAAQSEAGWVDWSEGPGLAASSHQHYSTCEYFMTWMQADVDKQGSLSGLT